MKIAVMNQKGGSGKTTTVILLAYALGHAGKNVGIKDYDPQKSATRWLETAPGEGVEIYREGADYDVVFLDTSPYPADPGTARAIEEADRILFVSEVNPMEMWGIQTATEAVKKARPKLRPAVLFTRFEAHTEFGKNRDAFAKTAGIRALKNTLPRRMCFKRAVSQGYAAVPAAERANLASLAIENLFG